MSGAIHQFLSAVAQLDTRVVRDVLERHPACVKARDGQGRGALQLLWQASAKRLDMSDDQALACKWDIERSLRAAGLVVHGQNIEADPFLRRLLAREVYAVVDGHQDAERALAHLTAWWDHALGQGWPIDAWAGDVVFQVEMEVTAFAENALMERTLGGVLGALVDRGASDGIFDGIVELAKDGTDGFEPLAQRVQACLRARTALAIPVRPRAQARVRA